MIQINHGEYQQALKSKSDDSLRFIIADCRETLRVNPNGEKAGYYMDEIHYAAMELAARAEKRAAAAAI